jgi:PAS domain S-box-containing protein
MGESEDINLDKNDSAKSKEQLVQELEQLRGEFAQLDQEFSRCRQSLADRLKIDDNLPLLLATGRFDGSIVRVNSAVERVLGWSAEESQSRPFLDFVHSEDRAAAAETFAKFLAGEPATNYIHRNSCKDGSFRWINWTVIPLVDRGLIFGIGEDVTERRRTEEALQDSERRLATLLSNLPGAAYRCTADGDWTVEYLSEGFRALTGYDPSEFVGRSARRYFELIHPDDRERAEQISLSAIRQQKPYELEYRMLSASGQEKWVNEKAGGVYSDQGELLAVEGFSADITSQKQLQLALQETRLELEQRVENRTRQLQASEAKYRALVESSPDAVVMGSLDGTITFASPRAAVQHHATDPNELVGCSAWELVVEDDREQMQRNFQSLLEGGLRRNDQYQGLRRDGTTFFGEVSAALIRDADGKPESFVAIYRDITVRKQAQDALVKEQDSLRHMLQASDNDRRLITYEIHDTVAQRLAGALMHFQAISAMGIDLGNEVQTAFDAGLENLQAASTETRRLMNRTRTPILDRFGVHAAIKDFIGQFADASEGCTITCNLPADRKRLEPALENTVFRVAQEAITNAWKHSQADLIEVSIRHDEDSLIVEVHDNGIGFDTSHTNTGGFGLDSIRERTRLLGKDLRIDSRPGHGTVVRAKFPLLYREGPATKSDL